MSLRVCVAGATGWVGSALCRAIARENDLKLVGAVARTHSGKALGEVLGEPALDVRISGTVAEALETPTDVLVDYTLPDVVKANVMRAIDQSVPVVIGTSGLTDDDYAEIDRAAREKNVGVIAAGNFAITAVLLQRFAREAARYLSHWEIVEYASATKPDAPSGTTRELVRGLSAVKTPKVIYPIENTMGLKEARGATMSETQVHSIRLPSYTIAVEVIFGEKDERLTIRHDAGSSPEPYLGGTLLAIRQVRNQVGLLRGLENLLD